MVTDYNKRSSALQPYLDILWSRGIVYLFLTRFSQHFTEVVDKHNVLLDCKKDSFEIEDHMEWESWHSSEVKQGR